MIQKLLFISLILLSLFVFSPAVKAQMLAEIPQTGWSLVHVDSEELVAANNPATAAFDGNNITIWHTQYYGSPDPPHPHEIQIDLGSTYDVEGFRY